MYSDSFFVCYTQKINKNRYKIGKYLYTYETEIMIPNSDESW